MTTEPATYPKGSILNPLPVDTSRTEPKVWAGLGGNTAGAIVASFVYWLVDTYWLTPGTQYDVPLPVTAFIFLVCGAALSFLAGRLAPHQYRNLTGRPRETNASWNSRDMPGRRR